MRSNKLIPHPPSIPYPFSYDRDPRSRKLAKKTGLTHPLSPKSYSTSTGQPRSGKTSPSSPKSYSTSTSRTKPLAPIANVVRPQSSQTRTLSPIVAATNRPGSSRTKPLAPMADVVRPQSGHIRPLTPKYDKLLPLQTRRDTPLSGSVQWINAYMHKNSLVSPLYTALIDLLQTEFWRVFPFITDTKKLHSYILNLPKFITNIDPCKNKQPLIDAVTDFMTAPVNPNVNIDIDTILLKILQDNRCVSLDLHLQTMKAIHLHLTLMSCFIPNNASNEYKPFLTAHGLNDPSTLNDIKNIHPSLKDCLTLFLSSKNIHLFIVDHPESSNASKNMLACNYVKNRIKTSTHTYTYKDKDTYGVMILYDQSHSLTEPFSKFTYQKPTNVLKPRPPLSEFLKACEQHV